MIQVCDCRNTHLLGAICWVPSAVLLLYRFIAAATELPVEQVQGGALKLRTKLLHKYLAPIEAEVRQQH
jgi:hypothetical protein